MSSVAFYCVTGADFFLGAVAMINSLRLHGHREPINVLDCGMTAEQRRTIAGQATVVPAPADGAAPSLRKLILPLSRPAETVVVLDADIIVARPLTELIALAFEGRLVAFANDRERRFDEWSALLDLPPVRATPYFSSSALLAGGGVAERALGAAEARQQRLDRAGTWIERGEESNPLYYLDQDVLNAVAGSLLEPAELLVLPARLSANPPFAGLRALDRSTLRCAYRDGTEPYLLHHFAAKPWLVPMRASVFTRLFTRLLLADDVALRLDPEQLPLELRHGLRAAGRRTWLDLRLAGRGIRRRLRRRPQKGVAWPAPR